MSCLSVVYVGSGCSNTLLRKAHDNEKTWVCDNAADEALKWRNYETAIPLHEHFLENEPGNALALYHLGYAYGQTGDYLREVAYYEKAIAHGFKNDRIFFNLGMAYGELNDMERAVTAFKKALEINPNSSDNHFGLAMAYYQSGIADKSAEEEFLKAIKLDPEDLDARLYLSILYVDMGELQEASEQLRKILQSDPTHRRARELLERINPTT